MPLIELITNEKSQNSLINVIDENIVNNSKVLYIKEKNIENIKNIKLETIVIDIEIKNKEVMQKIIDNAKYLVINLDLNEDAYNYKKDKEKIITYGYNSKSDITVSSIKEDESFFYIQKNIESVYKKNIEIQEIRANVNCEISVYNIMIIIALTTLYAK